MPGLKQENSQQFDGMVPVVVHMPGFSFVLISFYGWSGIGFSGENLLQYRPLGGLLRALQLPWIVVGDFNISAAALFHSQFASKLGAHIVTAPVEYTCDAGKK
eukprot:6368969-Pyramimonas_sp.AAC.1